jgi:uncharacterized membrane protein YeaQ/YmgE (transglycosylase-associated protein family)
MVMLFWIIAGLTAGWLVGMMLGTAYGIADDSILGVIGGLVGGLLAAILFVVSGTMDHANLIFALIAFTSAVILLVVKRVVVAFRHYGIGGHILLGIVSGLVGGSSASILFVVSGAVNELNMIGVVIVFGTMALLTIVRKFARAHAV